MTFSPARQTIKLTTNVKPRFERIRIVEVALPHEVRTEFQKRNKLLTAKAECAPEKLMPCGMRYPEPFSARPNFFIPILAVGSYVVPFIMLLILSTNMHAIPGLTELILYNDTHGSKSLIPHGAPFAILVFLIIATPMAAGALSAYILSKNTILSFRIKMVVWFAVVTFLVLLEIFVGAIFTTT